MKNLLSILLLCFCFSATAQPIVNSNCYGNDDLNLYFISDENFRSYLNSEFSELMCNDSLITNSIYHGPNPYEIDISQDYQVISLDGLQFIDIDAIGINNNGSLQYIPDLSNFLNLIELHITNSPEVEISGLSSLINLESLVLTDLIFYDVLSDLSNLTNLTELEIGSMSINELPDLSGLVNLDYLGFHSLPNVNSLPDLSHLSSLLHLQLSELHSLETLPHIPNQPSIYIEIYDVPNLSCVNEEIESITIPYYINNLPFCEGIGCSNPDFFEFYSFEETYFFQSNGDLLSTYQLNGPLNITVIEDDGSCNTEIIYGCSDLTSNNYDLEANIHVSDSCIYFGCTDSIANNYNSWANSDDESCEYIYGCLIPTASNYNPWTTNIGVDSLCIFIEETDSQLNELQNVVDSLKGQLESFLETYTPPVVEEEVVSDANSFDVLNPLSYNGEFQTVHYNFSEGNYTVPNGKAFIIHSYVPNNFDDESGKALFVNSCKAYNFSDDGINIGIVCSEGDIISSSSNNGEFGSMHGILLSKSVNTLHHDFVNGDYVVQNGKSLIINNYESNGVSNSKPLFINSEIAFIDYGGQISISIVCSEGDIISSPTNWYGQEGSMHGILIENSNYTYATDYELIDALNEGMDSLSSRSVELVQENDSISEQNAILFEENETLRAIDYNFDSLQYVADYLSSLTFELQQELLVPNIDVDMAIGWNMIGFSCPNSKDVEEALVNIVDEVIIFKDNNGLVYMPEYGFNGIGDLTPGHGYQLKITDYIINFNICE